MAVIDLKFSRPRSAKEQLLVWFLFSVVLATLPILWNLGSAYRRREAIDLGFSLAHGELLLVSVGILAAALGETYGQGSQRRKLFGIVAYFLAIVVGLSAVYSFADIASAARAKEFIDSDRVVIESSAVFFAAIATGASCIWFSNN